MNRNYPIPLPTLSHEVIDDQLIVMVSGKKVAQLHARDKNKIAKVLDGIKWELEDWAKKEISKLGK